MRVQDGFVGYKVESYDRAHVEDKVAPNPNVEDDASLDASLDAPALLRRGRPARARG